MQLRAYLNRIGFGGTPCADLATLTRLHRGHLETIAYENLDVLLARPLDLDPARIFDKLVSRRRGGWCYEMNGLLGWALDEIGFKVTRMAGGVVRSLKGDVMIGNHLVLLVELDRPFIADVGFGDGLFEPVPLAEGAISQHGFVSRLARVDGGFWRYTNHQNGGAPDFDFRAEPADPAMLAAQCALLQDASKGLPFTQNVIVQRRFANRVDVLRNALRFTARPDGVERRLLTSADEFVTELRDVFGLHLPEAHALWPLAERRGREMLAEREEE